MMIDDNAVLSVIEPASSDGTDTQSHEKSAQSVREEIQQENVLDSALAVRDRLSTAPTQLKVFELLADQKWHCRSCEGKQVASDQYAGGGGIQGLQRGNRSRNGLVIVQDKRKCDVCGRKTTWDRWTGEEREPTAPAYIPKPLIRRIFDAYGYKDAIEQRERSAHELIPDHRFPMERWDQSENKLDPAMPIDEIRQKFQVLKKDEGGNHNRLKSEACHNCFKSQERGKPLGIAFWYEGDENWPNNVPPTGSPDGSAAEKGCLGCGWYDMEKWRESLNQALTMGRIDQSASPKAIPPLNVPRPDIPLSPTQSD